MSSQRAFVGLSDLDMLSELARSQSEPIMHSDSLAASNVPGIIVYDDTDLVESKSNEQQGASGMRCNNTNQTKPSLALSKWTHVEFKADCELDPMNPELNDVDNQLLAKFATVLTYLLFRKTIHLCSSLFFVAR